MLSLSSEPALLAGAALVSQAYGAVMLWPWVCEEGKGEGVPFTELSLRGLQSTSSADVFCLSARGIPTKWSWWARASGVGAGSVGSRPCRAKIGPILLRVFPFYFTSRL